jgi:hypothetical protein
VVALNGDGDAMAQALLPVPYAWNASAAGTGRSACATHDLFKRAFSTAFGFRSIAVKQARTALSGYLRPPAVSAILAGTDQRFDLIVIPQEGDK